MPRPRHIITESSAITQPLLRRPANPLYRVHTGDTASSHNQTPGSSRACGLHQAKDPLTTHTYVAQQPVKALKKAWMSGRPPRKGINMGWRAKTRPEQTGWDVEAGQRRPSGAEATVVQEDPSHPQGRCKPTHPSTSSSRAVPLQVLPVVTPCAR